MSHILQVRKLNPGDAASSMDEVAGRSLFRALTVGEINEENRSVELAFSSDAEIDRWGDIEVLSHDRGAVDLGRLNNGANLLFNHDFDDVIGVVESARIDSDGKGRALVRFGKSARAEEVWQDVKDGILRNVSVGYRIQEYELVEKRSSGARVFKVTKWEPYEISIVTVPVDPSVGVNRSIKPQSKVLMNLEEMKAWLTARGIQFAADATEAEIKSLFQRSIVPPAAGAPAPSGEPGQTGNRGVKTGNEDTPSANDERNRARSIMEIGRKYKLPELAARAVEDGTDLNTFRESALAELDKRSAAMTDSNKGIGLTGKEADAFSFINLIRSISDPQNAKAREAAKFEHEVCAAAAEKLHRGARGIVIPVDVLNRPLVSLERRGDTVSIKSGSGYTGDGGNTVQTTLLTSSFIDLLRKKTTVLRRATVLTGLVGNFDIPKQTSGSSGYWIGEDEAATKDDVGFGLIGLRPHTVANLAEITRRMLMQSSMDAEAFVRMDLAAGIAQAIDFAAYYGDGTGNAPVGILNSNPNVVEFAGVNPTFAELVEMETAIAEAELDPSSSIYVGRAGFRGYAKTTQRFSGGGDTGTIWESGNSVNGYGVEITNQIVAGDIFFGDFSQFIVGMWGGLEITVDPYTHSDKGRLRIVCMQDVDFEARRPEAFTYGAKPSGS